MKDKSLAYKLYLQTLENIQNGDEVLGDRMTLIVLKKELICDDENDEKVLKKTKQK